MGEQISISMNLPLDERFDVIVVGGGPSGCTAAVAAARDGARTLLIEASGVLGGMGTSGLVPAWCPFSDKDRIIYGGLAAKVFAKSKEGMAHVVPTAMDWVPIDSERLKRVYDDLVSEAGVTVLFHTSLGGVTLKAPGVVDVLLTANKSGLGAFRAKVYVDCTGDGDLAVWAGAPFAKGDDRTGELMPVTHCFVLSNVDENGYRHGEPLHRGMKTILDSGKYPLIADAHACNNLVGPGTVGFNAGHLWEVDNTRPETMSSALMQGRRIAAQFRDALAEWNPRAFGNAFLAATGSMMGVRETRRVTGDYVLTIDDYFARRCFEDEIGRNSYPIDIHTAKNEIEASRKGGLNVMDRYENYKKGESHGIPYRCLTPKGVRNVLIAGRSVSCDRPVQASIRVMPVCLVMGEAAGMAAAMAARQTTPDVHRVDTGVLRTGLRAAGAYLP